MSADARGRDPEPDRARKRRGLRELLRIVMRRFRGWAPLRTRGDQEAVRATIADLSVVRGERAWFLVASAVIASVGLNTGSPAVVIGAMLISPLMGPIVGLGYALAVRDRRLAVRAGRSLAVCVVLSLAVSVLYFYLSPLGDPTAEILSRAKPNLLDLLVAVAAAVAGVIALSSVDTSATLPGVAIATAIMPPLCTAGYGIANGELRLGLGAFYLFSVNAVAIALSAYVLFGRMHWERLAAGNEARMPRWLATGLLAVFVAPLSYSLYDTVREGRQRAAVKRFVADASVGHKVTTWTFRSGAHPEVTLFLFDQPPPPVRAHLVETLRKRVPAATLSIQTAELSPETKAMIERLQSSVVGSNAELQRIQSAIEEARRRGEARDREARKREEERGAEEERRNAVRREETRAAVVEEWKLLDSRIEKAELVERADKPWLAVVTTKRLLGSTSKRALAARWEPWLSLRAKHAVSVVFTK